MHIFLLSGDGTKIPAPPVKGAKAPNGKPLTGNLDFGTRWSSQERIAILSNERLNSTCARLNSTRDLGSGIYFFISGNNLIVMYHIVKSGNLCYNFLQINSVGIENS